MLEGIYADKVLSYPKIREYPIHPQPTSGITMGSQAIYRYSLKDSDYPILTIIDKISDTEGNTIPAGHYELALSDEQNFLILMQTKNPVAIIPTFKVEYDKNADKLDKKTKKINKKKEKKREETNRKRAEVGMPADEEKIHMEASIEYIKNGNYFLIKYERGSIRAWGAIKSL